MNKEEIEKLIDSIGQPARIGDVLEKIEKTHSLSVCKMLLNFWEPCGFAPSLQQIVERSGWETGFETSLEDLSSDEPLKAQRIERLNSEPARRLFEIINLLINDKLPSNPQNRTKTS